MLGSFKIILQNILECFGCYFIILYIALTPKRKKWNFDLKKNTSYILKKHNFNLSLINEEKLSEYLGSETIGVTAIFTFSHFHFHWLNVLWLWGSKTPGLSVCVCVCVCVCVIVCVCVCSHQNAKTTGPISMKLFKNDP